MEKDRAEGCFISECSVAHLLLIKHESSKSFVSLYVCSLDSGIIRISINYYLFVNSLHKCFPCITPKFLLSNKEVGDLLQWMILAIHLFWRLNAGLTICIKKPISENLSRLFKVRVSRTKYSTEIAIGNFPLNIIISHQTPSSLFQCFVFNDSMQHFIRFKLTFTS